VFFAAEPNQGYRRELVCKFTRDAKDRIVQLEYFGVDGKPALTNKGFAKMIQRYADGDDEAETAYFAVDGKPINTKDGWSRMVSHFKGPGNQTGIAYFDKDGQQLQTEMVIFRVIPGTQAVTLGVKPGDVVATYNHKPVADSFQNEMARQESRWEGEYEE